MAAEYGSEKRPDLHDLPVRLRSFSTECKSFTTIWHPAWWRVYTWPYQLSVMIHDGSQLDISRWRKRNEGFGFRVSGRVWFCWWIRFITQRGTKISNFTIESNPSKFTDIPPLFQVYTEYTATNQVQFLYRSRGWYEELNSSKLTIWIMQLVPADFYAPLLLLDY